MSTGVEDNSYSSPTASTAVGAMPDRSSVVQQDGSGCHLSAVSRRSGRVRWSKEMNVAVMECYYMSGPVDADGKAVRGYRKRMFQLWKDRGYGMSEQRICDQVRAIQSKGWLSMVELDEIKSRVSGCGEDEVNASQEPVEPSVELHEHGQSLVVCSGSLEIDDGVSEEVRELGGQILDLHKEIDSGKRFWFDFKKVDRLKLGGK